MFALTSLSRLALAAPTNDDFSGTFGLAAGGGSSTGNNSDATPEDTEPYHGNLSKKNSVWFVWSSAQAGTFSATTKDSAVNLVLAAYTRGSTGVPVSVGNLSEVTSNYNNGESTISFNATANVTYYLAIASISSAGNYKLTWTFGNANPNPTATGIPTATPTPEPTATPVPQPDDLLQSNTQYILSSPFMDDAPASATSTVSQMLSLPPSTQSGSTNYTIDRWEASNRTWVSLNTNSVVKRGEGYRVSVKNTSNLFLRKAPQLADRIPTSVTAFTITLKQGPNLIGFPFNPAKQKFCNVYESLVDTPDGRHFNTWQEAVNANVVDVGLTHQLYPEYDGTNGDNTFGVYQAAWMYSKLNGVRVTLTILNSGLNQAPQILSFSPSHGAPGSSVAITGRRFSNGGFVTFNGKNASFSYLSGEQLVATVPAGATTGPIAYKLAPANTESQESFVVDYPNGAPDIKVRKLAETDWIGADIVNSNGEDQTVTDRVSAGVKASYAFQIRNIGTGSGSFKITGTAGDATCSIRYFDAINGGNEVTSQVTSAGYTTPTLAASLGFNMRVEVTPSGTLAGGDKTISITANAALGSPRSDTVKTVTQVNGAGAADLKIRRNADSAFIGDGIINSTGQNQTVYDTSNLTLRGRVVVGCCEREIRELKS